MTSELFADEGDAVEALDAAERALAEGDAVVFPTDTVYGVGVRPDVEGAVDRVFELKRRPRELTLPILAAGTADALDVAVFDERAMSLASAFWPGGLTLVLPRTPASSGWDLGSERETVGVRVPADGLAVALLSRTGPLAVTSANVSGEGTPRTCDGVREALGDRVRVYLCGRPSDAGAVPSTIVEVIGEPRVLREGAVPPEQVFAALGVG